MLGIISVDEPLDGRSPGDEDCDRLVALTQVAALAVEQAADAERDAGHRSALDRLLSLSLLTGEQRRRAGVLQAVCTGICETLGFQRAAVLLAENGGLLRPAATAGWTMHDPVFAHLAFTLSQFEPILTPVYERHGCHLLTREDAESHAEHAGHHLPLAGQRPRAVRVGAPLAGRRRCATAPASCAASSGSTTRPIG